MTSTARDSTIASEIGKYHLVAEIARGGMGNVYLAVSHGPGDFNKLLVVKELKPELCDDEHYVAMFLEEARLAARLTHPNIVQTNEVASDGTRHYMVMEFLDGRSLHRIGRFSQQGRFSVGSHLRVISEALIGLHYAHELRDFDGEPLGIVHRDVSPLNVVVTFDGQVKVLDFGIAKAVDSALETQMGVLKGRIAYMAPEQARGVRVDRRADIYAVGVMLWEAASGRRLWPGLSEVEILTRVLRDGPPLLRSVCPDAPKDLEAICARAMAQSAEDRYATAADLHEDLEVHLASRDDVATMREIGAAVGRIFADERRKMRTVIEETLFRVRGGPRSGVMPRFNTQVTGTPSSASLMCADPQSLSAPSAMAPPGSLSPVHGTNRAPLPASVGQPPSHRSRNVAIAASITSVLVIIGAAASLRRNAPAAPQAAVVAPAVATETAAHEGSSELIDLAVRVSPASARITVDGVAAATNPFHTRLPKDHQVHHVMVFADGYEAKLEDVSFASDVSIDVSLDRHANAATSQRVVFVAPPFVAPPVRATQRTVGPLPPSAAAPETPGASSSPQARPDITPAPGRAPLRPIVTSNPYGVP